MKETMRAMAQSAGGGFELVQLPVPQVGPGEVRVRVTASSINPADEKVLAGGLVGRVLHARADPLVVGYDVAGTVDALGEGVADLEPGAAVYGHLAYAGSTRQGAFSELVTLPREALAAAPGGVPAHQAAAAPTVALTSLQALRDHGELGQGGRALVIGAAGGVGSLAVGIGKRLGAHVTGVCSTKDVEAVQALGADAVIDRKQADPYAGGGPYDMVFDTPAVASYGRCAGLLGPGGTYVTTLPGPALLSGMLRALFSSRRCRFVGVASRREDLELVGGWLADGLQVPVDSRHKVADLGQALARQAEPGRAGKVVVDIADSWPQ